MALRTVRLDEDSERILENLVRETGLSISGVVKRGLTSLRDQLERKAPDNAWEIYSQLDLGPGGYATAPASESRQAVQEAIRRRHRR